MKTLLVNTFGPFVTKGLPCVVFPVLKQNHYEHEFKDDSEEVIVMTRWLMTRDLD